MIVPRTDEARYQVIFIEQSRTFKYALHDAKCSIYRTANAILASLEDWRLSRYHSN